MKLNTGDVAALRLILYKIRSESSKTQRRIAIVNLCDRAGYLLKKAERREQRPVHLKFETGDFD